MDDVRKMFPRVVERGLRAQHESADALASEVDRDDDARIEGVKVGEELGAAGGRAPEAGAEGDGLLEAFEERGDRERDEESGWGDEEDNEIRVAHAAAGAELEAEAAAAHEEAAAAAEVAAAAAEALTVMRARLVAVEEAIDALAGAQAAAGGPQVAAEEPQEEPPPVPPPPRPSPTAGAEATAEEEPAPEEPPPLAPSRARPHPFTKLLHAARDAVDRIPRGTAFDEQRHTAAGEHQWWEQNWQTTLPSLRENPTSEQALRLVASSSHNSSSSADPAVTTPMKRRWQPPSQGVMLQIRRLASPSWRATAIPSSARSS